MNGKQAVSEGNAEKKMADTFMHDSESSLTYNIHWQFEKAGFPSTVIFS